MERKPFNGEATFTDGTDDTLFETVPDGKEGSQQPVSLTPRQVRQLRAFLDAYLGGTP